MLVRRWRGTRDGATYVEPWEAGCGSVVGCCAIGRKGVIGVFGSYIFIVMLCPADLGIVNGL